jgi:amidophosphoribosyltransferase
VCGIAGFLSKRPDPEPIGRIMLDILTALARRGPDSVGVALYRSELAHREACWIRISPDGKGAEDERRILSGLAVIADVGQVERHEGLLRVEFSSDADATAIRLAIEDGSPDVEVVSLGTQLELMKQVGHPDDLDWVGLTHSQVAWLPPNDPMPNDVLGTRTSAC